MYKKIILISTLSILVKFSFSQVAPASTYYERLYYTCKAWGHMKYHHSELATGNINWDSKLLNALPKIKNAYTNTEFNDSINELLNEAGLMVQALSTIPPLYDSLNNNTDLSWIQDSIFSNINSTILDSVFIKFRQQDNYYVGQAWVGGNPTFDTDALYTSGSFPSEEIRLLALFRYWNIIYYFYPYKDIMDQDWETTLLEFIPKIIEANNAVSYHLAMKELTTRLNDSHAFFNSVIYNNWEGNYYAPFEVRFIENETVITKVIDGLLNVQVGDIIKKIDGHDIYTLRDSLRMYSYGSNQTIIDRNLNDMILYGNSGLFNIEIENSSGVQSYNFIRNSSNINTLSNNSNSIWRDTIIDECKVGIVDMGLLESNEVNQMFYDFWDYEVIIFDIRNYPNGTLWDIVNYLYSGPIHIAKFTVPDIKIPGRMRWDFTYIGNGSGPGTYQGDIIILFDERTQSQAEYTCMGLEQFPNTIKIGSTTAAADGNVSSISLPGGITTYATFLGTYYPDFTHTQRVGIIPDIEVLPTISGIRNGIDEVMKKAFENIKCNEEDTTTNINNLTSSNLDLLVYPNPVKNKLFFDFKGNKENESIFVNLLDILGKKVVEYEINVINNEIDFSNFTPGLYFIQYTINGKDQTQKIVKK